MKAAQAALDTRVQEAVQEAVRKLQEDQLRGGATDCRLGERIELSAGATWDESNPSGRAASFDC